jgi:hypothetical protein
MSLKTEYNFHQSDTPTFRAYRPGDDFYEALIGAHEGLSDDDSERLNARLVLLLANHIGDLNVLNAALKAAREDL